jgi:putative Mg2+ transporter-C (MgtC) family protein
MATDTAQVVLQTLVDELGAGEDPASLARAALRLTVAVLLAAVLGYDRERHDKAAGLRTHMLVGLGAALFIIAPTLAGLSPDELGRVLQGVVAGIGFLGAGAILKVSEKGEVQGLTTAAGIWATAAIAITAAFGKLWTATFVTLIAYFVLSALMRVEASIQRDAADAAPRKVD